MFEARPRTPTTERDRQIVDDALARCDPLEVDRFWDALVDVLRSAEKVRTARAERERAS